MGRTLRQAQRLACIAAATGTVVASSFTPYVTAQEAPESSEVTRTTLIDVNVGDSFSFNLSIPGEETKTSEAEPEPSPAVETLVPDNPPIRDEEVVSTPRVAPSSTVTPKATTRTAAPDVTVPVTTVPAPTVTTTSSKPVVEPTVTPQPEPVNPTPTPTTVPGKPDDDSVVVNRFYPITKVRVREEGQEEWNSTDAGEDLNSKKIEALEIEWEVNKPATNAELLRYQLPKSLIDQAPSTFDVYDSVTNTKMGEGTIDEQGMLRIVLNDEAKKADAWSGTITITRKKEETGNSGSNTASSTASEPIEQPSAEGEPSAEITSENASPDAVSHISSVQPSVASVPTITSAAAAPPVAPSEPERIEDATPTRTPRSDAPRPDSPRSEPQRNENVASAAAAANPGAAQPAGAAPQKASVGTPQSSVDAGNPIVVHAEAQPDPQVAIAGKNPETHELRSAEDVPRSIPVSAIVLNAGAVIIMAGGVGLLVQSMRRMF